MSDKWDGKQPCPRCGKVTYSFLHSCPMARVDRLEGDEVSEALTNIERACNEMLRALESGRYNPDPVHVRADLVYLRGEARRARRQRRGGGALVRPVKEGDK